MSPVVISREGREAESIGRKSGILEGWGGVSGKAWAGVEAEIGWWVYGGFGENRLGNLVKGSAVRPFRKFGVGRRGVGT